MGFVMDVESLNRSSLLYLDSVLLSAIFDGSSLFAVKFDLAAGS